MFEVTVFADLLATCRDLLEVGKSLLIKANVQQEGETVRGIAQAIDPLDAVILRLPATIEITVSSAPTPRRRRPRTVVSAAKPEPMMAMWGMAAPIYSTC